MVELFLLYTSLYHNDLLIKHTDNFTNTDTDEKRKWGSHDSRDNPYVKCLCTTYSAWGPLDVIEGRSVIYG
jgi:hypothetical protein